MKIEWRKQNNCWYLYINGRNKGNYISKGNTFFELFLNGQYSFNRVLTLREAKRWMLELQKQQVN